MDKLQEPKAKRQSPLLEKIITLTHRYGLMALLALLPIQTLAVQQREIKLAQISNYRETLEYLKFNTDIESWSKEYYYLICQKVDLERMSEAIFLSGGKKEMDDLAGFLRNIKPQLEKKWEQQKYSSKTFLKPLLEKAWEMNIDVVFEPTYVFVSDSLAEITTKLQTPLPDLRKKVYEYLKLAEVLCLSKMEEEDYHDGSYVSSYQEHLSDILWKETGPSKKLLEHLPPEIAHDAFDNRPKEIKIPRYLVTTHLDDKGNLSILFEDQMTGEFYEKIISLKTGSSELANAIISTLKKHYYEENKRQPEVWEGGISTESQNVQGFKSVGEEQLVMSPTGEKFSDEEMKIFELFAESNRTSKENCYVELFFPEGAIIVKLSTLIKFGKAKFKGLYFIRIYTGKYYGEANSVKLDKNSLYRTENIEEGGPIETPVVINFRLPPKGKERRVQFGIKSEKYKRFFYAPYSVWYDETIEPKRELFREVTEGMIQVERDYGFYPGTFLKKCIIENSNTEGPRYTKTEDSLAVFIPIKSGTKDYGQIASHESLHALNSLLRLEYLSTDGDPDKWKPASSESKKMLEWHKTMLSLNETSSILKGFSEGKIDDQSLHTGGHPQDNIMELCASLYNSLYLSKPEIVLNRKSVQWLKSYKEALKLYKEMLEASNKIDSKAPIFSKIETRIELTKDIIEQKLKGNKKTYPKKPEGVINPRGGYKIRE